MRETARERESERSDSKCERDKFVREEERERVITRRKCKGSAGCTGGSEMETEINTDAQQHF